MTIQRKYSLPNCTLVLEGLSDSASAISQSNDVRPLLSILVNVECHLTGATEEPLTGGRDFFESLVTAVSGYAQEFLSRVHHPEAHQNQSGLVQLQKVDHNRHRLIVNSATTEQGFNPSTKPMPPLAQIDLTTVQLFDLVEAVDQFFADSQTLPDLSLQLQPLSKRYAAAGQPLAKQTIPAAVGVSSLAVAAIGFYLIPAPQTKPPKEAAATQSQASNSPKTNPSNSPTPTPSPASPAAADLEALLKTTPEITDSSELKALNDRLRDQLDQAWKTRSVTQALVYRVGIAASDGAIVAYKPLNSAANKHIDQTPLPNLIYHSTPSRPANQESIAQFKVVFTDRRVLQVSPWLGYTTRPKILGPQIKDTEELKTLIPKVREQILQSWKGTPSYHDNLIFRVAVNKDGVLKDYERINQSAFDYVQETPLPNLVPSPGTLPISAKDTQEPLAHFQVTFKPSHKLEVNPWRG